MFGPSAAAATLAAVALTAGGATELLRLQDPELSESSGLAVSARHDRVLWTHNDGGDVAEVVAIDGRGRTVATVRLGDIDPYDPEALAPGRDGRGRPAMFLGDIGDNRRRRSDISVFRFREPGRLTDRVVRATWFRLTYPDGPHDAEALLVHPQDGHLLVATKDVFGGGLYRAPQPLRTDRPNPLTRIGDVPGLVTDGAFLPDGRYLLRTYTAVFLYDRSGRRVARAPLPDQEQGESLAVDGSRLLVGSEGVRSAVYAVPVPTPAAAPGSPAPTARPTTTSPSVRGEAAGEEDRWPLVAIGLTGVGVVVVAIGVLASRRRRAAR